MSLFPEIQADPGLVLGRFGDTAVFVGISLNFNELGRVPAFYPFQVAPMIRPFLRCEFWKGIIDAFRKRFSLLDCPIVPCHQIRPDSSNFTLCRPRASRTPHLLTYKAWCRRG